MNYKKVLSILSFILVMTALLVALVTDVVLFKDAILSFIGGIIISAILFIIFIIAMLFSIVLVFGIFILKEKGFWPLKLAHEAFLDILHDITITPTQIESFQTIRVVLLVICVVTFILSIIAIQNDDNKKAPLKGMSVTTLILSILGMVMALALLAISSLLK